MFLSTAKSFLSVINRDALVFLGIRLASIVLGITSAILLCQAVTFQHYFHTDGLGHVYDLVPLVPLIYSLSWSVVSLILPGCQRKYHPALDMGLDFLGWALTFAAGAALLNWSFQEPYHLGSCRVGFEKQCEEKGSNLSSTERSGAILLFLSGISHFVMFVRACRAVHHRRKKYVPSRNSFMQLQNETEKSRSNSASELNATTFTAADARVQTGSISENTERTNSLATLESSPV